MPEYNSAVLHELLDGCLKKNRRSQELLYKQFYGYAMSICLRYTRSREEAKEYWIMASVLHKTKLGNCIRPK